MESVDCNLCNSSEKIKRYELNDYLLDRPDIRVILVQCQVCGLIYQSPRFSLEEMKFHYPSHYDPYNIRPNLSTSWVNELSINYGLFKRISYVRKYKMRGILLDIGCGTGEFLQAMQKIPGWQTQGIEINQHAAQIAREKYGLNVFIGTLEQMSFSSESFDVVTLWDVLEHLHNPLASLREISRILKPDGILVIRVPNHESYDAHLFDKYWAGLDAPRHLYIFDPITITKMLNNSGFQIKKMSCAIGGYPHFIISIQFLMTAKRINESQRRKIIKLLQHPIVKLLTTPFFFIQGLGMRGSLISVTASVRGHPND